MADQRTVCISLLVFRLLWVARGPPWTERSSLAYQATPTQTLFRLCGLYLSGTPPSVLFSFLSVWLCREGTRTCQITQLQIREMKMKSQARMSVSVKRIRFEISSVRNQIKMFSNDETAVGKKERKKKITHQSSNPRSRPRAARRFKTRCPGHGPSSICLSGKGKFNEGFIVSAKYRIRPDLNVWLIANKFDIRITKPGSWALDRLYTKTPGSFLTNPD